MERSNRSRSAGATFLSEVMVRRCLVALTCLLLQVTTAGESLAQSMSNRLTWVLFDAADFDAAERASIASRDRATQMLSKSDPGAPTIRLREPIADEVSSPLDIALEFTIDGDADIDLESLSVKVKRGFIWLDVTDRLFKHAEVSAAGIRATDAKVPEGRYQFLVSVADTMGRRGYETFRLICT